MTAPGLKWFERVRAWPIADAAARVGLEVHIAGHDVSFACPACKKERRHTKGGDKRLAAKVMPNARWWCEPCGAGGDAVALAAAHVTGRTGGIDGRGWSEVRRYCADRGLCDSNAVPPPPKSVAEVPKRPPAEDLGAFWAECRPLADLPPEAPALRYLEARGFAIESLKCATDSVRVAAPEADPSRSWWPAAFQQGWPLVFGAYDHTGTLATLQGRALSSSAEPKTRWPSGCSASGVFFADRLGVTFLQRCSAGECVSGLQAVIIAEGATDTLKLASVVEGLDSTIAVLGYVAGSQHALKKLPWPSEVVCLIAVDDDEAGDRYSGEILRAVNARAPVFRVRPPQGRAAAGAKLADWSDLPDADVAAAITDAVRWEVCHE